MFILHWIKAPLTFDVILFKDPYELVPQQTAVGPHKNMVKTIEYKNNIMLYVCQYATQKEKNIWILRLNGNHSQECKSKLLLTNNINAIYIEKRKKREKHLTVLNAG